MIFKECTRYNSDEKILLNLSLAMTIIPTNYAGANAIVTYHNSVTDPDSYYVRETYEELRAAIEAIQPA